MRLDSPNLRDRLPDRLQGLKTNHWLAIGVVVVSVLWLASGFIFHFGDDEAEEVEAATLRVIVDSLDYQPMPGGASVSGRTEANHGAIVVARTNGIVLDLPVREGETVREGQVVARLSDEARSDTVREARARLDQAAASYAASAALAEQGFYPRLELEARRAEQAAAQAALDRAQAEAARSIITAPVNGVLDELLVEPGEGVQIGAEIARIVDLDPLVAAAGVSDAERRAVSVGDPATVTLQGGTELQGVVRFVAASADPATATYRLEVEMPNPDGTIPAGQIADIRLASEGSTAAQIVRSAVTLNDEGVIGVKYVDAGGVVQFAPIQIVRDGPDGLWISGPPADVRVIVRGQEFANAGATVEVVDAADAARQEDLIAGGAGAEGARP